jgi:hypothetical protein
MQGTEVEHSTKGQTDRGRGRLILNRGTTTVGGGPGAGTTQVSGPGTSAFQSQMPSRTRGSYKPRSLAMMTFMISLDPP